MPNLDLIKKKNFIYIDYNKNKMTKCPNKHPIPDPPNVLDKIKKNTFKLFFLLYNKLNIILKLFSFYI